MPPKTSAKVLRIMSKTPLKLSLNPFNQLVLHPANDEPPIPVTPVRAFPIASPDAAIALVDHHGHEHVWIDALSDVPSAAAELIRQTLARREITPIIVRITQVSRFATPSTWHIDTDHGATELQLKTEDDIRHLPSGGYLITDAFGLQFTIPQRRQLDRHSQRLLARFL